MESWMVDGWPWSSSSSSPEARTWIIQLWLWSRQQPTSRRLSYLDRFVFSSPILSCNPDKNVVMFFFFFSSSLRASTSFSSFSGDSHHMIIYGDHVKRFTDLMIFVLAFPSNGHFHFISLGKKHLSSYRTILPASQLASQVPGPQGITTKMSIN